MRVSQWLLGGAATAAIAATIASGCGGSTSGGGGGKDSGPDAAPTPEASAPEAAAEAGLDAGSACTIDADLTQLDETDAEIGDSGATDIGCYTCIKVNCGAQLSACNTDCACNNAVVKYLACFQGGGSIVTCGAALATGGGSSGLPLAICTAGSAFPGGSGPGCLHECGVSFPEAGAPEAGATEAGATEAGADAGPG